VRSNSSVINVYKKNNIKSEVVTQLLYGDTFKKIKKKGPWIKIKNDLDHYKGFIKNKKYPFWRLDVYFSNLKSANVEIINDGGRHFTNLKSPKELFEKMKNFGHHDEFDISGITLEDIEKNMREKKVFYNHFADKGSQDKWEYEYELKKASLDILPNYLQINKEKYNNWLDL